MDPIDLFIVASSVLPYILCNSNRTIKTQMTNKNVDLGFQGAIVVVCAIVQRSCKGSSKLGKAFRSANFQQIATK
jgi:hypothetical protein